MFNVNFKGDGFDKIKRDLDRIQKNAKELEGTNNISFEELFPQSFISKYTKFNTLDEMFKKSGFNADSQEDFEKIPEKDWNEFISENTNFTSWQEMLDKAMEEWTSKKIFGK